MRFLEKVPVKVEGMVQGSSEYVLLEIKSMFSIIVTHLAPNGTTALHSHAFNALTIWLKGWAFEEKVDEYSSTSLKELNPGSVKLTRRSNMHRIISGTEGAWFITFRGPWKDTWQEERNNKLVTLTHGRKEVEDVANRYNVHHDGRP